jgi:hypothetical protein
VRLCALFTIWHCKLAGLQLKTLKWTTSTRCTVVKCNIYICNHWLVCKNFVILSLSLKLKKKNCFQNTIFVTFFVLSSEKKLLPPNISSFLCNFQAKVRKEAHGLPCCIQPPAGDLHRTSSPYAWSSSATPWLAASEIPTPSLYGPKRPEESQTSSTFEYIYILWMLLNTVDKYTKCVKSMCSF